MAVGTSISKAPWEEWVQRIVLHVPRYLLPDGKPTIGGLQRNTRDIARLIRERWGRECIIVQKARTAFETQDIYGTPVVGVAARLSVYSDPAFGRATRRFVGKNDAIVYMGGEDAWPYIVKNAKGFHAGVWWDGPFSPIHKAVNSVRVVGLFRQCRSVLTVDTNVINWIRAWPSGGPNLANKAVYVPNCVDLQLLGEVSRRSQPAEPFRLLCARRFEKKRGQHLVLDAVEVVLKQGYAVKLLVSSPPTQSGSQAILAEARRRGIIDNVEVMERDLSSVYSLYRDADAAIVPTLWSEGTSYACVEAIGAGLPVIVTNVGGLSNLVIDGFNGFITSPKVDAIVEAIKAMMNKNTWRNMHQNSLCMRTCFGKDRWDERLLSWLRG